MFELRRIERIFACVALACALACGSSTEVTPEVDEFDLDPAAEAELDEAAADGDGAEGTYTFDDGNDTLSITITASTFACAIEVGTFVATVLELTSTTMVWQFVEDGGMVTWTRVDNSEAVSVVGVWKTTEPMLFLVLSADGRAQIFGEGEVCDDERPRNERGCVQMVPTGLDVSIDGDLSEWADAAEAATVRDDQGDHGSDDPGADLRALKVDYSNDTVFVLFQLWGAPSTSFQGDNPPNDGSYRVTVQGDNGLSLGQDIYFDAGSETWTPRMSSPEVSFAVGADGLELAFDVAAYVGAGFERVDFVMIEPRNCAAGCDQYDSTECGYFDVPR